jgi:GNAT superfamily N-acetyltransferase
VPEGELRLDFRDMTEADLGDGLRLSRASGWNQTFEDWRLLVSLGPGLFRVAVEEGRIVASGGAVRYGDDLAWICMILVDPEHRGRGIGTRVFDDVLARTESVVRDGRLRAVGLDATPAGRGIYLQRGFVEGLPPGVGGPFGGGPGLVRMRVEPGAAADAPRTVHRFAVPDLDPTLALDREVFGADRGPVLRWALGNAPDLAWVAHAGGRVAGYCFGRHGDHSDHVGPVVAEDAALARDLVLACLSRPRSRPLILDARVGPAWLAALAEMGFREQRPFTRMYLGSARPPARPALEPAVFGPEFG